MPQFTPGGVVHKAKLSACNAGSDLVSGLQNVAVGHDPWCSMWLGHLSDGAVRGERVLLDDDSHMGALSERFDQPFGDGMICFWFGPMNRLYQVGGDVDAVCPGRQVERKVQYNKARSGFAHVDDLHRTGLCFLAGCAGHEIPDPWMD